MQYHPLYPTKRGFFKLILFMLLINMGILSAQNPQPVQALFPGSDQETSFSWLANIETVKDQQGVASYQFEAPLSKNRTFKRDDVTKVIALEIAMKFPQDLDIKKNFMIADIQGGKSTPVLGARKLEFGFKVLQNGEEKSFYTKLDLLQLGKRSLNYYQDNDWHHFILQIDTRKGRGELWIDGELLPELLIQFPKGGKLGNKSKPFSEVGLPKGFRGQVQYMAYYHEWLSQKFIGSRAQKFDAIRVTSLEEKENISVAKGEKVMDEREYVVVEGNSVLPWNQLESFPLPRYKQGHQLMRLYNWMDMKFAAGFKQPWIDPSRIGERGAFMQEELISNWNYMLTIHNPNIAGQKKIWDKGGRLYEIREVAQRHPEVPIALTTLWAQSISRFVGKKKSSAIRFQQHPETAYVLGKNGKPIENKYGKKLISPAVETTLFRSDVDVIYRNFDALYKGLGRPVDFINENGEVPPKAFDWEEVKYDKKVKAKFQESGYPNFEQYLATEKLRIRSYWRDELLKHPLAEGANFSWYAIDAGPLDRFDYEISRQINKKNRGQYYSTPDFYPRYPGNWNSWISAWRGYKWIKLTRVKELALGDNLYSPYVAAGWNRDPKVNVRPSQWLALLKVMNVSGAEFFYTGFFNVSKGKGERKFPDSRNYIWQVVTPAYAQAVASHYEEILLKGNVAKDDKGEWALDIPCGDLNALIAARKHASKEIYVVAGGLQPPSNIKGAIKDEKELTFQLAGKSIIANFRKQGSVYLLDLSQAEPICYQLDSWHEIGHPLNWSKNFHFDAPMADEKSNMKVVSEGIISTTNQINLTHAKGLLLAQRKGAEASWSFQPRETGNNYGLRIHMNQTGAAKGKVEVLLDGKMIGTIDKIGKERASYCKIKGKEIKLKNLSKQAHKLTIRSEQEGLLIEKVELVLK
ncbi:MAG: hypothetical protein AAFY71_08755 [Bacteroidota bacterium]